MIRTHVQLTQEQAKALKRVAAERGVSISALIREAVEHVVTDQARDVVWRRALAAVGSVRGDKASVSEEHDRYLADAYRPAAGPERYVPVSRPTTGPSRSTSGPRTVK